MKIGIDVSQLVYQDTGVANYLAHIVQYLLALDTQNEYILFFSSLRRNSQFSSRQLAARFFNFKSNPNFQLKQFSFPPTFLDFLWNKLHIAPIEWFIGDVDIFITSDWTEPPTKKAKKLTILYDLIVYKHPEETDRSIVQTQRRKLKWVKKESDTILCISEATKRDAMKILGIPEYKLKVICPGI